MADTHLTELAWKNFAKKHSIKETALSQALAGYGTCAEDNFDGRIKALAEISKEAGKLKTANKGNKEVAAYLGDIIAEVGNAHSAIENQKKKAKPSDDSLDLEGALAKVKQGLELQFTACVGRPYAVAVAAQITGKHRDTAKALNKGSTFINGNCIFEQNAHTFVVPRVQTGMAKKLKAGLHAQTGKGYKVRVRGTEDGLVLDDETDRDDEQPTAQAPTAAPDLSAWQTARAAVVDKLHILANELARAKHEKSPNAVLELNAVIKQLTPTPTSRHHVQEIETYIAKDRIVKDVCRLAFDFKQDLLRPLEELKKQMPA
jgi:hypothetical protein